METVWIWLVVAVVCLMLEVLTGTLLFLFFGLAGVVTAGVEVVFQPGLAIDLLVLGASGLLMTGFLRQSLARLLHRGRKPAGIDAPDLNQRAIARELIDAGSEGAVEYQGSHWTGVNTTQKPISAGAELEIVATDGIKLRVRARNSTV